MEIKNAFFCDHANFEMSGKLNVMGIFDDIGSGDFPVVHPQMCFVLSIEGLSSEIGQHQLKINFIDEDGTSIIPPLESQFNITSDKLDNTFMINLQGINIPKPGIYSADVIINNQHKKSVKLRANQV